MLTNHQDTLRRSRSCLPLSRRLPMTTRSYGSFDFLPMRLGRRIRKANIKVDVRDGILGHFCNSQGEEYNILKQGNVETVQRYAFIPNGADPWVVRKIAYQVGFVKSLKVDHADGENSHHRSTEVGATEHERTTSGLTSEREQSALLDVEKPTKKKRRPSEA